MSPKGENGSKKRGGVALGKSLFWVLFLALGSNGRLGCPLVPPGHHFRRIFTHFDTILTHLVGVFVVLFRRCAAQKMARAEGRATQSFQVRQCNHRVLPTQKLPLFPHPRALTCEITRFGPAHPSIKKHGGGTARAAQLDRIETTSLN